MAEHFSGRHLTVHTSNGGATEMLRAWITLGERQHYSEERDSVLGFLRAQFQRGDGGKSFSLNPPPEEIRSIERLECMAQLVSEFASELAKAEPDATLTTIKWDRDLRLRWLAQMLDLFEIIEDLFPSGTGSRHRPKIVLSEAEFVECALARVGNQRTEAIRRGAAPSVLIELLDEAVALLLHLPIDAKRDARLSLAYQDRGDVFLSKGDVDGAIFEFGRAMEIEPDDKSRKLLGEVVAELRQ